MSWTTLALIGGLLVYEAGRLAFFFWVARKSQSPRQPIRWRRAPILMALALLVVLCYAVSRSVHHAALGVILAVVGASLLVTAQYASRWVIPDPIRGYVIRQAVNVALLLGIAFALLEQGPIYVIALIPIVVGALIAILLWQSFQPSPPRRRAPTA